MSTILAVGRESGGGCCGRCFAQSGLRLTAGAEELRRGMTKRGWIKLRDRID
jgi:hypothetical protein